MSRQPEGCEKRIHLPDYTSEIHIESYMDFSSARSRQLKLFVKLSSNAIEAGKSSPVPS
jgi:hypothetical protein